MKDFKLNYMEVFTKSFIVRAESEEEAMEKLQYAAEYIGGLVDVDDFDHWKSEVERVATENDIKMYDELPEE